jgi:epoxyqueuosine reductase
MGIIGGRTGIIVQRMGRAQVVEKQDFGRRDPDSRRTGQLLRYDARMSLTLGIKERALRIGFDLAGVAPIAAWKDLEFSRRWVERGFGGEMRYLSNPGRDDPRRLLPSAQSVVCVGLIYNAPLPYSEEVRRQESEVGRRGSGPGNRDSGEGGRAANPEPRTMNPEPRGWISRYAWGHDYHRAMRAKLEELRTAIEALAPGAETRVYVDKGPVVERAFARLSGIGWMGKNTCLINQQKGSWLFLGVVLTSLALEPDLPAPDRCGSCTRCIEACPTDALVEPYVMNASRCIAYLNIELKGSIPEEFRPAIGNNVFGCDICQDVCPWNGGSQNLEARNQKGAGLRRAATTGAREFWPMQAELEVLSSAPEPQAPRPRPRIFSLFNPPLDALASMSEDDFKQAFCDSPVKRVKYRGWLRNLCVAMGNSRDPRFVPRLRELASHPDSVVREHAAWAMRRLAVT